MIPSGDLATFDSDQVLVGHCTTCLWDALPRKPLFRLDEVNLSAFPVNLTPHTNTNPVQAKYYGTLLLSSVDFLNFLLIVKIFLLCP